MRSQGYALISLYVLGNNLDPGYISGLLGIAPSKTFKAGDSKVPGHPHSASHARCGWVVSLEKDSNDISAGLLRLLAKFAKDQTPLGRLPGVDEAYIDVFLANGAEDLSNVIEFDLGCEVTEAVARLELPIRFSVCNVVP
jgi:hypothetical protein